MNRYRKFFFIALILLLPPCYMAFAGDTFSTAIVSVPALLFFVSAVLVSAGHAIRRKDATFHLIRLSSSLLLMVSLAIPFELSDRGLRELTRNRMEIIARLQPVFVRYCAENGHYPVSLDDLVPGYLDSIPEELVHDGTADPYKKIDYEIASGEPRFHFHTIRGPDSSASLNVVTGDFWHDR